MRITPAAVFTAKLKNEEIAKEIIKSDTSMTHPSDEVKDCIFQYCRSIHYLLNNPSDKDRANKAFSLYTEHPNSISSDCKLFFQSIEIAT